MSDTPETNLHQDSSAKLASLLGFLLLLAVWLPPLLIQMARESNLWIDETYSLLLANESVPRLVEQISSDVHPPGYYLLLKAWLKTGRIMGFEPGVLWARLPNLGFFLLFAGAAWFGGRHLLGRGYGTLAALAAAGCSFVVLASKNARGYAACLSLLFLCLLLFMISCRKQQAEDGSSPRGVILLWLAYAFCGIGALWAHYFAAIVLALHVIVLLALTDYRRAWASPWAISGLAAHVLIAASLLPWASRLGYQFSSTEGFIQSPWAAPADLAGFFRVLIFWFPWGGIEGLTGAWKTIVSVLGVLALIVPVSAIFLAAKRGPRRGERLEPLLYGSIAAAVAFTTVLIIWGLPNLGLPQIQHWPRYTVLVAPFWALGIGSLSGWAAYRLFGRIHLGWAFMAPWFLCCLAAPWLAVFTQPESSLIRFQEEHAEFFPDQGEALYILPPELIPYFRRTLGEYDLRRIEELPSIPENVDSATILNLSIWRQLDRLRDQLVLRALEEEAFAEEVLEPEADKEAPPAEYQVYRLEGINHAALRDLFGQGIRPRDRGIPGRAVSVALPENQLTRLGWSHLEINPDMSIHRWGRQEDMTLVLDQPVQPGGYVFHLNGFRPPYPAETVPVTIRVNDQEEPVTVELPSGRIHLELPLAIRESGRPSLHITHPTWVPAEYVEGSEDPRSLTFLMQSAWLEPQATE